LNPPRGKEGKQTADRSEGRTYFWNEKLGRCFIYKWGGGHQFFDRGGQKIDAPRITILIDIKTMEDHKVKFEHVLCCVRNRRYNIISEQRQDYNNTLRQIEEHPITNTAWLRFNHPIREFFWAFTVSSTVSSTG
jgi:hypothetical protein